MLCRRHKTMSWSFWCHASFLHVSLVASHQRRCCRKKERQEQRWPVKIVILLALIRRQNEETLRECSHDIRDTRGWRKRMRNQLPKRIKGHERILTSVSQNKERGREIIVGHGRPSGADISVAVFVFPLGLQSSKKWMPWHSCCPALVIHSRSNLAKYIVLPQE